MCPASIAESEELEPRLANCEPFPIGQTAEAVGVGGINHPSALHANEMNMIGLADLVVTVILAEFARTDHVEFSKEAQGSVDGRQSDSWVD